VKPNTLTKLLCALIKLLGVEDRMAKRFFDEDNNFSFLNSEFLDVIEKHIASMKLLLKSEKSTELDSHKAMSKSINFMKNGSNLFDFRSFGQSAHFENLKQYMDENNSRNENFFQKKDQKNPLNESNLSEYIQITEKKYEKGLSQPINKIHEIQNPLSYKSSLKPEDVSHNEERQNLAQNPSNNIKDLYKHQI